MRKVLAVLACIGGTLAIVAPAAAGCSGHVSASTTQSSAQQTAQVQSNASTATE